MSLITINKEGYAHVPGKPEYRLGGKPFGRVDPKLVEVQARIIEGHNTVEHYLTHATPEEIPDSVALLCLVTNLLAPFPVQHDHPEQRKRFIGPFIVLSKLGDDRRRELDSAVTLVESDIPKNEIWYPNRAGSLLALAALHTIVQNDFKG